MGFRWGGPPIPDLRGLEAVDEDDDDRDSGVRMAGMCGIFVATATVMIGVGIFFSTQSRAQSAAVFGVGGLILVVLFLVGYLYDRRHNLPPAEGDD